MANDVRYEVGAEIARGDFATVYRGRDLRLNRDVAIKQLHQQYLDDPKQTERYWQEAQILARLEHPHVMTIYDVVPERGWLILELMKGSLKDQLGDRPIHLNDLRLTILFAARALSFFQQQNIIHGDVKPSNLLIDRNNVIKLGDFGIARRLQSGDGSAIKGTTRYIAPEVVSDKFGPVGPHSDIYSLGFSAYELLCGERFESLFPGLHMFGRDTQLAWIMWHSAPDRRLPRIKDVLEGVPEPLAAVIEKMTEKDPARRYRSADEIIEDLTSDSGTIRTGPTPEELEQAAHAARQARRKRYLSIGAFSISLLLCVAMLFPFGSKKVEPAPPAPTQGVVGRVVPDKSKIFLKSDEILLIGQDDLILLDGAVCELADLEPNDQLAIQYFDTPGGKTKRIRATRGEAKHIVGRLESMDEQTRTFAIQQADSAELSEFVYDGQTPILLNGVSAVAKDLQSGDHVDVQFWSDEAGLHAVSLRVLRQLQTDGVVDSFDATSSRLSWTKAGTATTMSLAPDCHFTINGKDNLAGRAVKLSDLAQGDQILNLVYDAKVLQVDVRRDLSDVAEVWSVDPGAQMLSVLIDGDRVDVSAAGATIKYQDAAVDLSFLRKSDKLVMAHSSPDYRDVTATSIEVSDLTRDDRTVAIVICQQAYENIEVTPYEYALRDAQLVMKALDTGLRVPATQLALFQDLPRDQLIQQISEFLGTQPHPAQLLVYFVGQAYVDLRSDTTYLAARDFRLDGIDSTGWKLRDLITLLEGFQAREKLLILDTCHKVSAVETQSQPSTGDQIRKTKIGDAVSRSVTVIGSSDKRQDAVVDPQQQQGRFAMELGQALQLSADSNADQQVSADELFRFLASHLTADGQEPVCFQPDTRPPRLTPEAAEAVRVVLAELSRLRPSSALESRYATAKQLCGRQPDAELAYALIKFKSGRTGESLELFRAILGAHPQALVAYHTAAYQHLAKKEWVAAADLIENILQQITPRDAASNDYLPHLLQFCGTARGFVVALSGVDDAAKGIDAAAAQLSPEQRAEYDKGLDEFRKAYDQTPLAQRESIRRFYAFDFDIVRQYLLEQLK